MKYELAVCHWVGLVILVILLAEQKVILVMPSIGK